MKLVLKVLKTKKCLEALIVYFLRWPFDYVLIRIDQNFALSDCKRILISPFCIARVVLQPASAVFFQTRRYKTAAWSRREKKVWKIFDFNNWFLLIHIYFYILIMLLIILISKLDFYFSSFLSVSHQCSFIIYFLYKYSTHPFIFLLFRIFYSETKYIFSFKVLENLEEGLRRTEYPQRNQGPVKILKRFVF